MEIFHFETPASQTPVKYFSLGRSMLNVNVDRVEDKMQLFQPLTGQLTITSTLDYGSIQSTDYRFKLHSLFYFDKIQKWKFSNCFFVKSNGKEKLKIRNLQNTLRNIAQTNGINENK